MWEPAFPDDLVASAVFDAHMGSGVDLASMTVGQLDEFAAWAHAVHSPVVEVTDEPELTDLPDHGGHDE